MKKSIFSMSLIATSAVLIMGNSAINASEVTGNVSAYIGEKALDDKDWPNLDDQEAFGVLFDIKQRSWPVSIAINIIGSAEENKNGTLTETAFTGEQQLGIKKYLGQTNSTIRPYIGGGITLVTAALEKKDGSVTTEQDDTATGLWLGGGVQLKVTPHFILGLDARYSEAEVTLFGEDREAGGLHTGITAGYHW